MRYEKRGERPPWPGLEAWRRHPQRQLRAWAAVGLQRLLPAPLGLPLCLPRSASPSALATSCFSSCPLPCSLVGSHQRSRCSMFTKRPTRAHCIAHTGAGHGSTCPPCNRPPLVSLLQVSWPLLWRQAAHRRHSQHHRGGQTCAGAWHTSSSIPPIPRPGGHQDAMRLAITPTHHPRALAHHPCCLWSPVEASGGAAGFKSTDLSSIFSAAANSWLWR